MDLNHLQQEDEELSSVRAWVEAKERPHSKDITSRSYAVKSLWNQFSCLEIKDGLLVRRIENLQEDTMSYQAVIQRNSRRAVPKCCHDMKTAGHLGGKKTLNRVRQKFFGLDYSLMFAVT